MKSIKDSKEDIKKTGYDETIIGDFYDTMIEKLELAGKDDTTVDHLYDFMILEFK